MIRSMRALGFLGALVGCASPRSSVVPAPHPASAPSPAPAPVAVSAPFSGAAWPGLVDAPVHAPDAGWVSRAQVQHPLVGRIWDVQAEAFLPAASLLERLRSAGFVLLGEKHDNVDHHVLEAWVLSQVSRPGLPVVFEMLDDADPVAGAADPAALEEAVAWAESGWPAFSLYRPVFAAVYEAGAAPVGGHPTREDLRTVMMEGLEEISLESREDLRLEATDREEVTAPMLAELRDAHCGYGTDAMLPPMLLGQRVKDAWMARALRRAGSGSAPPSAVLVAGGGHVRPDRAVPQYLDGSVALLFAEVPRLGGAAAPEDWQGAADFVWFTPRLDDRDPCEAFEEQLQGMGLK